MRLLWQDAKRRIDAFLTPNRLFFIIIAGMFAFHACKGTEVKNCSTDWDGFSNSETCD